MKYINRVAEKSVKRLLKIFPVIGVTGPRQSGKSTLLQHILKDYEYVSFDDIRKINYYREDPIGFINRYKEKIIFDEVQKAPEFFNTIKYMVDKDRLNYGNFVLTGSSNFLFLKKASESLAGRIGLISLLPFQYSELPLETRKDAVFKGGYPELVIRNYFESDLWYSSYVDTYINKDLRSIANVGDIRDFRRFIQLLAARISQTLDMTHYANDLGVAVSTIKNWISILEASYIVFLLPSYHSNQGKRIVKTPKMYFFDTGLVSYLTGIRTYEQFDQGPLAGPIFENYVISEIYKKHLHSLSDARLYFMRTYDKKEIDLIIDHKDFKEYIEIKKSSTFKLQMIKSIKNKSEGKDKSYLLFQGEKEKYLDISILPFSEYLLNNY